MRAAEAIAIEGWTPISDAHGSPARGSLDPWVVGQAIGVVRIGMAAGEAEDPLGLQVTESVAHLSVRAIINQAPRETVDQPLPRLPGFQ